MENRAYSVLQVKSLDEESREIRGIATTPTTDRVGDIVEPLGFQFQNPVKFLLQHDHSQPIGDVWFEKPSKKGVEFRAVIKQTDTPGNIKERLDDAWESVKLGLLTAVSIGFKAKKWEPIANTGGLRFLETEGYELSLVTIPANSQAIITAIKSLDTGDSVDDEPEEPANPLPALREKAHSVKIIPRKSK